MGYDPRMRRLLILRHAKSSWDDPHLDDHDRPLNGRGKRDAPRVGERLREERILPDRIVSSTAVRARRTAEEVAEACGYDREIALAQRLYGAEPDDCLALLRELPDEDETVMLVGHNPCLEDLVARLAGRAERMPTAALAVFDLPLDSWAEITSGSRGKLLALWRPKES
jgi:phosphohistidine phosphatase